MASTLTTTSNAGRVPPLLRAAHIGPCVAVTIVAALLSAGEGLAADRSVAVTTAVFTGQLTIGWANDLVDANRDRAAGRLDKPVANGELSPTVVRRWAVVAACACVVLSFSVGWRSGLVHVGLGVASGHAYNVLIKGTPWSWVPYAVAFGTLPAVVTLATASHHWPPVWLMGAAAGLGVGAHFLNTLPDLVADAATGVRGLPQRLGAAASRGTAVTLLVAASLAAVLGPPGEPGAWGWTGLAAVLVLAVTAAVGRGRLPFQAAMFIALVDVVLLVMGAG